MKFYKWSLIFASLLAVIFTSSFSNGQVFRNVDSSLQGHFDGPYLLYTGDKVDVVTVEKGADGPIMSIESIDLASAPEFEFEVKPNKGLKPFNFKLFSYGVEPTTFDQPDTVIVVSDPEGNFSDFAAILRVAGVINEGYEWRFGRNHLVVNGDLFDRDTDVMPILWLCYKLDYESRRVGGHVHIVLGNHDEMNLRGNTKYVDQRYLNVALKLDIEHKELFGEDSELGRWLRTKNCITVMDTLLFVHGGISPELIQTGLSAADINSIVRENLGLDKQGMEGVPQVLWSNNGPFWYRGMVISNPKYSPISSKGIDEVLTHFSVNHVIVGHCILPQVTGLHGGKVIAVDVDHPRNRMRNASRVLRVTKGKFSSLNDLGDVADIPILHGFIE